MDKIFRKRVDKMKVTSVEGGTYYSIRQYLSELLSIENFRTLLTFNEKKELEIKFGGDGLVLSKKKKLLNFYFGILNLRERSFSPRFNYLIGSLSQEEVRKNIGLIKPIIRELEELQKTGVSINDG